MKTIGIIGGMSWESTASYYRLINEGVKSRLGGLHSASIVLLSLDFGPIIHLADATAEAILAQEINRVGLLGTSFTMEQEFYRGRLEKAGLDVLIPEPGRRSEVNRIIYHELCMGSCLATSREYYVDVISELIGGGAGGIILGCTEIGLLIDQGDAPVPLFDTTAIHCKAAVDWMVQDS